MSILEELLPGSYKGVPFLISLSTINGGRKDAKKSFPNSNRQSIEDLGLQPRIYDVEAIIASDALGENYLQRRDRLLLALEEGGRGILIHPFYGQLNNIVSRSFTLIEDLTELGQGRIRITFEVSDVIGVPTVSRNTLSSLNSQKNIALGSIASDIANRFIVSSRFPINFTDAVSKLNNLVEEFQENITSFSVVAEPINEFNNELGELSSSINQLIPFPLQLSDSITGLFNTVNGLYSSVESTLEVFKKFFGFGDTDVEIVPNTLGRLERKINTDVLNNVVQGQALTLAYFNAAQIDFQTVVEVDSVATELEIQYQKIFNTNSTPTLQDSPASETGALSGGLSEEAKASITDLRTQIREFFDNQRLTAQQIVSVRTPVIPARVLAYQYYGSSELGEGITELNDEINVTFMEGNIRIFTE